MRLLAKPSTLVFFSVLLELVCSLSVPHHEHAEKRQLPTQTWYHSSEHPVHALFRRQDTSNNLASVGSPAWVAAYPSSTPDTSKSPQPWTDALNAAVAAGKIPNVSVATATPGGNPVYPSGQNGNDRSICSATDKCRAPGDVWDGPNGTIGIGFDDGPVDASSSGKLYSFLKSSNQKATHFMIGVAILQAPNLFLQAFNNGDDIAVHTWTHPYMTTLTNEQVVAQFGWTMQIISDSTGGRVPKFWRPPYGDMDNRIRAIAKEVFGLTPILWNQDTADWRMTVPGGPTPAQVASNLNTWITGPKSPGLIILEHELSSLSVQAFINAYPTMGKNGWKTISVSQIVPSQVDNVTGQVYWNAAPGANSSVLPEGITDKGKAEESESSASASSTASSNSPSSASNSSQPASPSSTSPSSPGTLPVSQNNSASHNYLGHGIIYLVPLAWTILLITF